MTFRWKQSRAWSCFMSLSQAVFKNQLVVLLGSEREVDRVCIACYWRTVFKPSENDYPTGPYALVATARSERW